MEITGVNRRVIVQAVNTPSGMPTKKKNLWWTMTMMIEMRNLALAHGQRMEEFGTKVESQTRDLLEEMSPGDQCRNLHTGLHRDEEAARVCRCQRLALPLWMPTLFPVAEAGSLPPPTRLAQRNRKGKARPKSEPIVTNQMTPRPKSRRLQLMMQLRWKRQN